MYHPVKTGTGRSRPSDGGRVRRCRPTVALLLPVIAALPAYGLDAPPPFSVCVDFHCRTTAQVALSGAQWQRVGARFQSLATAGAEREAIRRAIALLETLAGRVAGTWRDKGRNVLVDGREGQLDCIAESRNTTTFLRLLENAGLLHWHSVEHRVRRRRWLVSEHWTAVIREHASGRLFSVDSWYLDNGQPPCIQPLADWRDARYPATCAVRAEEQ